MSGAYDQCLGHPCGARGSNLPLANTSQSCLQLPNATVDLAHYSTGIDTPILGDPVRLFLVRQPEAETIVPLLESPS